MRYTDDVLMMRSFNLASCAAIVFFSSASSWADPFPTPKDRNNTLDIHFGSALGSAKIIGMGGTAAATARGSSGMLGNASAPAVRASTSNESWDWDWHLATQKSRPGIDFDNNGIKSKDTGFTPGLSFGLAFQYQQWGIGFTALSQATNTPSAQPDSTNKVLTEVVIAKFGLARSFYHRQLVLGLGQKSVFLDLAKRSENTDTKQTLIALSGTSVEGGFLWKPKHQNYRIGGNVSLPVVSNEVDTENCNPLNCAGYILPEKIKVPWSASLGIASQRGSRPWNTQIKSKWRDEQTLLWAADIILTGKTKRGIGLEAFSQHQLQPSGRNYSLSLRGGLQYEWFPGRLRLRAGSYYEPSRFNDPQGDKVAGRVHATGGFELRFWSFSFWNEPYRTKISGWFDFAENFNSSGLSLGFWH